MNLIHDSWIPVRRKSGRKDKIAPWEITAGYTDDPITALASPRPDFDGALVQFQVGLLQTTFAPEGPNKWDDLFEIPPKPEQLRSAFETVAHAFELFGDGPRFMQDLTLAEEAGSMEDKDKGGIGDLIMESPGENTLKNNTDHFIKRGAIGKLCPACAASALFSLQTNAPSGGQGHRTGLRGGGPLTTLVAGDTLWQTCWLSVLEKTRFLALADSKKVADSDIFPWLGKTRTSEKKGGIGTTAVDVHPAQIFWAMPRRIRLQKHEDKQEVSCDLCGEYTKDVVTNYITKNYGVNYEGNWKHPLSPYNVDKDNNRSAVHPQPGGIGYRHWLGLVQADAGTKGSREPAMVVETFLRDRKTREYSNPRLWAFGYDMDNMKARCWYDSVMPLVVAVNKVKEEYEDRTAGMVRCARQACQDTRSQVKKVLFNPKREAGGDMLFVDSRFWQNTEADFFSCLNTLRNACEQGEDVTPVLERWHKTIVRVAEGIFDDLSQDGMYDAVDPKRVALARRDLKKYLCGKKMRGLLGLT